MNETYDSHIFVKQLYRFGTRFNFAQANILSRFLADLLFWLKTDTLKLTIKYINLKINQEMVTKRLRPVVETEASLVNVKSFDLSPKIQPQLFLHLHNTSVYY